jgi:hypothetical protein
MAGAAIGPVAGRALGTGTVCGSVWATTRLVVARRQRLAMADVKGALIISSENVSKNRLFMKKTLLLQNYGEEIP